MIGLLVKSSKTRLDQLLIERALANTRDEAQRLIRAGQVLVEETVCDKPGHKVDGRAAVRVQQRETPYVSRGGLKLAQALAQFAIDVAGWVCADLGASTGGFTDCLLRYGAARVYAIDVGYGQLAYSLQVDERVVVMDRTNCRYVRQETLGEQVDLVVGDLSFISVQKVREAIESITKPGGELVLLIKPQFEIGKGRVGKKGLVSRPEDHAEVLQTSFDFWQEAGWRIHGICASPIQGKSGNLEFLLHASRSGARACMARESIMGIVEQAHHHSPKPLNEGRAG